MVSMPVAKPLSSTSTRVSQDDLPTVATNLYKFVRINDAFAARCGCDARTNIGVGDVGFPAYLFRLDPEDTYLEDPDSDRRACHRLYPS
jgi:hypothetical protein